MRYLVIGSVLGLLAALAVFTIYSTRSGGSWGYIFHAAGLGIFVSVASFILLQASFLRAARRSSVESARRAALEWRLVIGIGAIAFIAAFVAYAPN